MRFKRFCALSFSIGIICFVINHLCSEGLLRYATLRFTIPCALRFASVAYLNALKRLMRSFIHLSFRLSMR